MQVQKLTHEVRLQKWSEIIRSCRSSGKPIKTWCSENNINLKTYYHWQKHVCQATCRELSLPQKATTPVVSQPEGPVFAELRRCGHRAGGLDSAQPSMLGDLSRAERIYLACGYTDLRQSIDGLAATVQQRFHLDPLRLSYPITTIPPKLATGDAATFYRAGFPPTITSDLARPLLTLTLFL